MQSRHRIRQGLGPIVLAIAIGVAGTSDAQQAAPAVPTAAVKACGSFAWPLERERAWFANSNLPHRVSGSRLRRIDRAVELTLKPTRTVEFFLPPQRPLAKDGYSGEVTFFGVPHPGLYQVTLSNDADIDVFENGTRLKITVATSATDCPGVRTSARFDLAPGDLVLVEISNASVPIIKAAFAEAQ